MSEGRVVFGVTRLLKRGYKEGLDGSDFSDNWDNSDFLDNWDNSDFSDNWDNSDFLDNSDNSEGWMIEKGWGYAQLRIAPTLRITGCSVNYSK